MQARSTIASPGCGDLAGTIERLFHARLEIRIDGAVRKGLVEALTRLAIYDDSTANVRTSLDKLVKRGHFVPTAKQQHDLAIGESRERLESSIDVGCLRIVEEIDAIDTATGLETVLERLEALETLPDTCERATTGESGACSAEGILDIVSTLNAKLPSRDELMALAGLILVDEHALGILERARRIDPHAHSYEPAARPSNSACSSG